MDAADDLDAARRRFPVGDVVTGRVVHVPQVGVIGLFVDLGVPPTGFVDVLLLPRQDEDWPEVGATATFEVVQHRPGPGAALAGRRRHRAPAVPVAGHR